MFSNCYCLILGTQISFLIILVLHCLLLKATLLKATRNLTAMVQMALVCLTSMICPKVLEMGGMTLGTNFNLDNMKTIRQKDMKKNTFNLSCLMLLGLFMAQNVWAQSEHTEKVDMNTGLVVWTGSTVDEVANQETYFFLVEFKDELNVNDKEKYVGARGDYGVQGILSSVGMRMQLVTPENTPIELTNRPAAPYYQFVSRIDNADNTSGYLGDRMGIDNENNAGASIYLDRGKNRNMYNNDQNNCNNFPNWKLNYVESTKSNVRYKGEATSHTVTVNTYTIQNVETQNRNDNWNYNGYYKPTYITVRDGKLVTTFNANEATKWIIVSEADFQDAMAAVTWGEVDLGVFVQDATFGRDNKDGVYWVWKTNGEGGNPEVENGKTLDGRVLSGDNIHWHQRNQDLMINGVMLATGEKTVRHQDGNNVWYTYETTRKTIGKNVAGNGNDDDSFDHNWCRQNLAQYYAAEIYNEENSLLQTLHGATIPNLIDGLYKFTAQALYYDDEDGYTNNGVAYFVVKREELDNNGQVIPEKTTIEYMPIKPMMNESLGITIKPHSGVSAGYVFNNNENAYLLTTYVEINGKTNLTIGIEQRQAKGWTVIGNVHLYAHGKQALMVDEDWGVSEKMTFKEGDILHDGETGNPYTLAKWYDNYDYPSTVYYQRTFTKNAWNTICMPLDLTGRQVRQAFGDKAKVCEFIGQKGASPDGCILFKRPLDLDQDENMNKVVIKAGVPYIIYVTTDPQKKVPEGAEYFELEVGNGQFNHTVRVDGDCYEIPGVIKQQYTGYHTGLGNGLYELKAPKVVPTDTLSFDAQYASDIRFVGSFYHTLLSNSTSNYNEYPDHPLLSDADYWVVTKGNMYHLTGQKDYNIWATYAYLYLPKSSGGNANRNLTFAIEDGGVEEQITVIEGLFIDQGEGFETDGVYTLSGQKVADGMSLDGLPKGIYVMKGKKYVVK